MAIVFEMFFFFLFCLQSWALELTLKEKALLSHNAFLLVCKERHNRKSYLQRDALLSVLQLGSVAGLLSKLPAHRLMLDTETQSPRVSRIYRLAFSLQILCTSPRGGQIFINKIFVNSSSHSIITNLKKERDIKGHGYMK